jgi:hypothetical protein
VKALLDAGAFVGVERRDRRVGALLRVLQERRVPLWTSAGVVAQVWRDGARQAMLARILTGVGVHPLTTDHAKRAGSLQGAAHTDDVVDAHLALLVDPDDHVLTGDPGDIRRLLDARGIRANIIKV